MGGFVSALGDAAERGLQKVTGAFESKSAGRGVLNLLGNDEWELELNPEGKAVKAMAEKYSLIRSQSLNEASKPRQVVADFLKNDNNARSNINPKTATVQDIHNYAVNTRHPIQVETQKILNMHMNQQGVSNAADKTLETLDYQNKAKAKLDGIAGSFGPKFENLSPILARMQTHPDPRVNLNGERILDIVSNILRDTKTDAQGKQYSEVKNAVAKAFNTVNKLTGSNLEPPKAGAITYNPPTQAEQTYKDILRTIQLPAVLLPHLSQYAHLAMTVPMKAWADRAFQHNASEVKRMIDMSGVLSNTQWEIIHSDILSRTGKISQWTNSPTAGSIINKMFHQPGFQWMRLRQISFTASLGFHSAIHWAAEAANGDKRAILELKEMGLDPAAVVRQGGKLNEQQLAQGMFHFTNNRMFFDRPLDQSLWMNKNFLTRSMFMYHSFLNSETAFIRRELLKMFKAGDVKGIAKFAGVLGVAVPAAMPLLKSAEILARTGSPRQAGDEINKDYSNLSGEGGVGGFALTYIDMLSTLGGIGIFRNYITAINGNMFLNALAGPMISTPIQQFYDVAHGAIKEVTKAPGSKTEPLKPAVRDLLSDIPVVGRPLSHQLAPTTKDEPKPKFGRTHRLHIRRK